jgi:hypothetical protein
MPPDPSANGRPALSLQLDPDALRPLVAAVVAEVLAQLQTDAARLDAGGNRLAFSEEEAARLLGLEPHVLRDERRRGCIAASSIVGRRIRYTKADLLDYLAGRRLRPTTSANGHG